jgi:tetratricopeptide (TPR) repeat protein
MKRIANWALPVLLIGALTSPALAQAQAPSAAQQEPKWKDNKEYTDYMVVYDEKDHAKKAASAEKFFVDHKEADPIALTHVFKMMYLGYANAGNWVKVLESYDRMGTLGPKLTDAEKQQYTQIALIAAANSKNNPRTIELAEAILKNDPNNFNALITLSGVLSQNLPQNNPQKDAQITRTLEVTKKALDQPRPQGVPDAQWNPIQVQLRETTCLMLLNQNKYQESISECQAAIKLNPKDSYAWYWIGLSHRAALIDLSKKYNEAVDKYNANRTADQLVLDELRAAMQGAEKVASDKRDETADAFARAAAIGGDAGTQAKQELQKIFEGTPDGTPENINRMIEQKKSQLGN